MPHLSATAATRRNFPQLPNAIRASLSFTACVAQFSSHFKLGVIRRIWEAAPEDARSFFEALNALQNARFQDVKGGRMVSSTSGANNSVSFMLPSDGTSFTPRDFFELMEELLISYEQAQANGLDDENQILAYMREQFRPVKSFTSNFMYLAK